MIIIISKINVQTNDITSVYVLAWILLLVLMVIVIFNICCDSVSILFVKIINYNEKLKLKECWD